jgi:hypothetical protein
MAGIDTSGIVGGLGSLTPQPNTPMHKQELFWGALILLVLAVCMGIVHIGGKKAK